MRFAKHSISHEQHFIAILKLEEGEILGHKRMEITYKYVHLDRTNLREGMETGAM
jgi:hypothetical protein